MASCWGPLWVAVLCLLIPARGKAAGGGYVGPRLFYRTPCEEATVASCPGWVGERTGVEGPGGDGRARGGGRQGGGLDVGAGGAAEPALSPALALGVSPASGKRPVLLGEGDRMRHARFSNLPESKLTSQLCEFHATEGNSCGCGTRLRGFFRRGRGHLAERGSPQRRGPRSPPSELPTPRRAMGCVRQALGQMQGFSLLGGWGHPPSSRCHRPVELAGCKGQASDGQGVLFRIF